MLALAIVALALAPAGASAQPAPLNGTGRQGAIRDQYIVVMKRAATGASKERTKRKARASGAKIERDYSRALNGYAARLPAAALAQVRADPDVAYVEADGVVSAAAIQLSPPWGLDRIDQSSLPLSGSYSYTPTGSGVKAYIIDTGIRFSHSDFAGRAESGYDAIDGGAADDCNGHGTHVAGTVGGSTYGVAKLVRLVGVRVLDCNGSGTISGVIAGIDWVTASHGAGQPAVANMSLGGAASSALDAAVQNSIDDGVSYAVAAGNENADACLSSPARAANALTVASTTSTDARSSFSNFGTCVDLFAPGSGITSSWHTSDTATKVISGTSMAAPHVAGAAALYLHNDPAATPATVAAVVNDNATTGKVTGPGTGSPNRLLLAAVAEAVDTLAPDTSIDATPSGVTASPAVSLAFSSSETPSTFECRLDGPLGTIGSYVPCSSPIRYTSLADGSYTFSVRATDAAGNTDLTAATSSFRVDTTAPQTTISSAARPLTASSSVSFGFSSSETPSTFECRLDGPLATIGSYVPCSSSMSYTRLADGSYTFSVRATDAAGNIDLTAATSSFTIDTTAPQTTISSAARPLTASPAVSFGFSSSKTPSTFECRLDGPLGTVGGYVSCSSSIRYTSLADGSYTFSVRATDAAGNTDLTAATSSFTIDTTAPETAIDPGSPEVARSSSTTFAFSSSEAGSTFECKLDGPDTTTSSYATCSSPISYTSLVDGSYSFSVRATDAAGNTDPTAASSTFKVRTSPPAPSAGPTPAPAPAPSFAPPPEPVLPPVDSMAPLAALTGSKLQTLGRYVGVGVLCRTETCVATVRGVVNVPRNRAARGRLFRLKTVTTTITKGATVTLRPKLSYSARRAIRRALARGRRIAVRLSVTTADAANNSRTLTRRIKLRLAPARVGARDRSLL